MASCDRLQSSYVRCYCCLIYGYSRCTLVVCGSTALSECPFGCLVLGDVVSVVLLVLGGSVIVVV